MAKEAIWTADVELFTKTEQLNMIESALRVRVCSVYEMRRFAAKIKIWPDCDSSHTSVFGFCVDINNLYGGVMQKDKLPQSNFMLNSDITPTNNNPDVSPVGCFVGVSFHY